MRPVRATLRRRLHQTHKLSRILREPVYRSGLKHGVAASIEHDAIPYAADFRTVVDAGANRGQFALVAMRRFPHAALWCFEPLPHACETLKVILGSRANAHVLELALTASSGSQVIHVTRDDDSSSLRPVTKRNRTEFPRTNQIHSLQVPTVRLDEVLRHDHIGYPALLKIDVQGSELEVLKGSEQVLDLFDAIIVECSFVELYAGQPLAPRVIDHLQSRAWHLNNLYNVETGHNGERLQADLLFEPSGTSD